MIGSHVECERFVGSALRVRRTNWSAGASTLHQAIPIHNYHAANEDELDSFGRNRRVHISGPIDDRGRIEQSEVVLPEHVHQGVVQ